MSADFVDLSRDLRDLARLAGDPTRLDDVLEYALDSMKSLIAYDLAVVLELDDEVLKVRSARGPLANERVRQHKISLDDFPSVREALASGEAHVLLEHDHSQGEGDPYDGVLDLPHGHSCMVVPLYTAEKTLGALTFDREKCERYSEFAVRMAGVYGQIVALAIAEAEKSALLDRYRRLLEERHRLLLQEVTGPSEAGSMLELSRSPLMTRLVVAARQVATTPVPVLIHGETGTGKEVLAAAIHEWSQRRDQPFIKINCAALPETLIESELFGHTKGAFSGADQKRLGRFVVANSGTLLLDEIGELPLPAQAKLLRVLQEGTFSPVGSDQSVRVDVRILAATHIDLEKAIAEGRFRQDLFYRLNVFPVTLPALRERKEDIEAIARNFLDSLTRKTGRGPWSLDERAVERLRSQPWPGNVRELRNVLERATILQPYGILDFPSLSKASKSSQQVAPEIQPRVEDWPSFDDLQRRYFRQVLDKTKGKIYGAGGAAELLGLNPSTLQSRMKKLGIERVLPK